MLTHCECLIVHNASPLSLVQVDECVTVLPPPLSPVPTRLLATTHVPGTQHCENRSPNRRSVRTSIADPIDALPLPRHDNARLFFLQARNASFCALFYTSGMLLFLAWKPGVDLEDPAQVRQHHTCDHTLVIPHADEPAAARLLRSKPVSHAFSLPGVSSHSIWNVRSEYSLSAVFLHEALRNYIPTAAPRFKFPHFQSSCRSTSCRKS